MVERVGGAVVLPQSMLTPERLVGEVSALLADPARLKQMGEHARALAVPDAAERIVALLSGFCG
jgi:UDP-N-acetylglucosamine--N-acetylmuramyl-(pentapeptide) pyrophosphoryl-undecaprenol N-acetylglucosamine transferase